MPLKKSAIAALLGVMVITITSCASYKTTLTNAQGQTVTCEASGKNGVVTGYYLRRGFEDCVARAKEEGFKENPDKK